jgi:NAD(P)-dependent dehydrogenase (short-subunit alcohol dehydrogenase family)
MAEAGGTAVAATGRVVMVSGANRGIGRAVAERLYADGYHLSLGAREPEGIAGMASERVLPHAFEATDPAQAEAWVAATVERFGRIDALVNNAGITREVTLAEGDEAALDELWSVNVKAPFRLTRLALPHLCRGGQGRVVNIASLSGLRYKGGSAGYAMSKFAVSALSHATRYAGWEDGVRVTTICPGPVATDMAIGNFPMPPEEMTQPESIAELVSTVIALPNTASVAVVPVNCVLEATV